MPDFTPLMSALNDTAGKVEALRTTNERLAAAIENLTSTMEQQATQATQAQGRTYDGASPQNPAPAGGGGAPAVQTGGGGASGGAGGGGGKPTPDEALDIAVQRFTGGGGKIKEDAKRPGMMGFVSPASKTGPYKSEKYRTEWLNMEQIQERANHSVAQMGDEQIAGIRKHSQKIRDGQRVTDSVKRSMKKVVRE